MADLTAWEVAILAVAAYVAIVTLVRLMRRRRDTVIAELQAEVATQQGRKRGARRREAGRTGRPNPQASAPRNTKR